MLVYTDAVSVKLSNSGIIFEPERVRLVGRTERTRAEILNAAFKFLWSRPFRDMTVENLMAQTSVSRPSFYNYFADPHELMESLLAILEADILAGVNPWLTDDGDPVALLHTSLATEVRICYQCGPFLKAVTDAAATDARVEAGWYGLLGRFDDAVYERIAADQELGLIGLFDPRPLAPALNQINASMYIRTFGQRPRGRPGPVLDAITRLWISSLYGQRWVAKGASDLYREQGASKPGARTPE
jgi:AcrR family transcriptional regulator